MEEKIKQFLETYNLTEKSKTYLVAFSGGFDSMCLLHILKKISTNKIIAIHLNHNWRGEESDNEELNCKNFCKEIDIEFYSEKLSKDIPHTETAAREARYKFFENCAKMFDSKVIFTAHNKNDNAETLIYRIAKGTGINGLCGILSQRDIYYRPLLNCSRQDIESYCEKNNLNPNSDSSNQNILYKRNFIRKEILPNFEKINSNFLNSMNTLSVIASEETEILEEYLANVLNNIYDNEKNIITPKFIKLSDALQRKIIFKIFSENNLDYDRQKILNLQTFIKENAKLKSGKTCSLDFSKFVFVNSSKIEIFEKKDSNIFENLKIDHCGIYENNDFIFEILPYDKPVEVFPKDSENIAYVDLSDFEFDFELRTRNQGDIIKPLGVNGCQKLKKYLISKHIPNHKKNDLLFLAQEKEILWAINLGISDRIKVKTKPTHCIKFIVKKEG